MGEAAANTIMHMPSHNMKVLIAIYLFFKFRKKFKLNSIMVLLKAINDWGKYIYMA